MKIIPSDYPNSALQIAAERRKNFTSWILTAPALLWLIFFFLVPYIIVIIYSFLTADIYDVKFEFTLDAYRQSFTP